MKDRNSKVFLSLVKNDNIRLFKNFIRKKKINFICWLDSSKKFKPFF